MKPHIEYINHTADIGFIVKAPELSEIFVHSAIGMFQLIADITNINPDETRIVDVNADDIVRLMHEWLSELLFIHATEHLILVDFEISELTERHIVSIIKGKKLRCGDSRLRMEIKGVTMHNLDVKFNGTYWEARIIFDI